MYKKIVAKKFFCVHREMLMKKLVQNAKKKIEEYSLSAITDFFSRNPWKTSADPLGVRGPQVGNHCSKLSVHTVSMGKSVLQMGNCERFSSKIDVRDPQFAYRN
jgi:hypothetical protein